MRGRPVCILCLLLVVFLCVTDWLGFSMKSSAGTCADMD